MLAIKGFNFKYIISIIYLLSIGKINTLNPGGEVNEMAATTL